MGEVIARSPEGSAKARRVVAYLFTEAMDPTAPLFWRIYLQMEPSTRKRWFCRLHYFAPTAVDYQWAERHRINRNLIPFLRPFRLLRKRVVDLASKDIRESGNHVLTLSHPLQGP